VTHRLIARQRLGKHISAGADARNNETSIARPGVTKHASLTTEAVFSAWSVQSGSAASSEVKGRVSGRQPAGL
jgi:hypothetical protein